MIPSLAVAAGLLLSPSEGAAEDTVVYWGADVNWSRSSEYGFGADLGLVTALNGDLAASGWTFAANAGASHSNAPGSETNSFYDTLLLGHLWQLPDYYVSLSGGAHFVDNDENPGGGPTDGGEVGAIVQYGFETKATNAFYAQSYGGVSTVYDQIYLHAKAGYKAADLRYGAELTLFDEKANRKTLRYGAFIGDIAVTESVSMVISAGYQEDTEPGDKDGIYATVGFSVPLSLR
jgi:hypothetical protein